MRLRRSHIKEAHEKTFEWIFTVPTPGHSTRAQPSPKFADWLENDGGVYWIAGKVGSGKSTSMKYLCGQERTSKILQKWAGSEKLVFASYFF